MTDRNSLMHRAVVAVALVLGCTARTRDVETATTQTVKLETLRSLSTAGLRGLSVVSDEVVWASGSGGTVLRTTNGGATWDVNVVPGADSLDFRDIHAFSAANAVAMATAGRIYRTLDGGLSWNVVYAATDTSVFLDAVSFWDSQHGVVMGDPIGGAFLILLTDDGGASWHQLPPDRAPRALEGEAAFAASGTCLTVWGNHHAWFGTGGGAVARVFRTADRGQSWTAASTPLVAGDASAGIFSVAFEDSVNGVVAGGDYRVPNGTGPNVAFTRDGGRTFTLAEPQPGQYVSAIANAPAHMLVAAGIAGTIYQPSSAHGWSRVDSAEVNSLAFSRSRGWVVGPKGFVGRIVP